ncbi:AAA family ATPase [Argonema antarcticum]|uniref:AAA family ATPase n=1 Tax=Argonema antarcticum TaxID=2942763 RepID=UPI002011DF53|nr:AAA family ATPase [Argonema antarcticum]MCL1474798.1 AAA family ATPase [Argonema antarcticum A004/B2]
MLTRIEINGFKTFDNFTLSLSPFGVILGPNAAGKSNLFDALRFLSQIGGNNLRDAVRNLRGEAVELFRRQADGTRGTKMSFAVELLLAKEISDPWGDAVEISHSRVRYEVEIELRQDERGLERLIVAKEAALPIQPENDRWRPLGQEPSSQFREAFFKYSRSTPWLTTVEAEGVRRFQILPDNQAGRTHSATNAEATVLSSITSAEFPHLFAIREEMRAMRFLQLDPRQLRQPSATTAALELEPDGANLATVLARIQAQTATLSQPKGVIADIAADLASLIPGVVDVIVEEDEKDREYRIEIGYAHQPPFSSRVVSDGTLRVLALLTILHDPEHRGLVCFEEPENGVHPSRLMTLIQRLREGVTAATSLDVDEGEPFFQILLNSHSPVVLSCLEEGEAMFADLVSVVNPEVGSVSRKTRIRPVATSNGKQEYVSRFEVERYLSSVDRES